MICTYVGIVVSDMYIGIEVGDMYIGIMVSVMYLGKVHRCCRFDGSYNTFMYTCVK